MNKKNICNNRNLLSDRPQRVQQLIAALPAVHSLDMQEERYKVMVNMLSEADQCIFTKDNHITVFADGEQKFLRLFEDIENAVETVHLEYFIFRNDRIGKKMIELLARKASQGVEVRLLCDYVGCLFTPDSAFKILTDAGGEVLRSQPPRLKLLLKIANRNHRKIVVIDGKIGYLGGMNICDDQLGMRKRVTPWRDTHMRMTGSCVYFLQERFVNDWADTSRESGSQDLFKRAGLFPAVSSPEGIGVQLVSSGPDCNTGVIGEALIQMVSLAQKSICIQTPYFVPDGDFIQALKTAAASGVDVRIMVPSVPDKKFVYRVTMSYVVDLMSSGIKVYRYPGFLHAKMVIMDGMVTSMGTANVDMRSFKLNFEMNAFIYDKLFGRHCMEIFEKDLKLSSAVSREWYESRSGWIRLQEWFFRLFSKQL